MNFWAKIMFKDFIRHYRKMSPEEIVKDVMASMDDIDEQNAKGDSFGAFMLRQAEERAAGSAATASRENGAKGGRPPTKKEPMPQDKNIVFDFAEAEGLDTSDAFECWEATMERGGKDANGRKIYNWKAYVTQWCKTRAQRRKAG